MKQRRFHGNDVTTSKQSLNPAASQSASKMSNSEQASVATDNDPPTTKSDIKIEPKTINGHISQIPGLSPVVSPSDERVKGRRVGVLDSDSEYVKLAKQGGHKGLLWHDESVTSKPTSYKPPAWFCTASEDINYPSLINSEEKKSPGAFQRQEPPFGSDNMSAWERVDSSNSKEKNNNLPNCQMEKLQISDHCRETGKFRRIVFDKKPAPVDMSKLLSFGYAEQDDKHTSTADVSTD